MTLKLLVAVSLAEYVGDRCAVRCMLSSQKQPW